MDSLHFTKLWIARNDHQSEHIYRTKLLNKIQSIQRFQRIACQACIVISSAQSSVTVVNTDYRTTHTHTNTRSDYCIPSELHPTRHNCAICTTVVCQVHMYDQCVCGSDLQFCLLVEMWHCVHVYVLQAPSILLGLTGCHELYHVNFPPQFPHWIMCPSYY